MPKQPPITVTQAAAILGCTRQNVLYLLDNERLRGKFTLWPIRHWQISRTSVNAYRKEKAK